MSFSKNILVWFKEAKRDLPFRRSKDPYRIWLSEIMAQQTQIDTLVPYFMRFTEAFPNVEALANAPEDAVLKAWEGLGYYSRARNLHKAAKIIFRDFSGHFPGNYRTLITLPGIGPYTGGAIASIAFNEKVPAVDGNVLRVVTRYNNWSDDIGEGGTKKKVTAWVQDHLPDNPGDFNEALMELGALICTPTAPTCLLCPNRSGCAAYQSGTTDIIPVKKKKVKQKTQKMEVALLYLGDSIYLVKRPNTGLLSGLWSFPIVAADVAPGAAIHQLVTARFPHCPDAKRLGHDRHVFSHIIWEMEVYVYHLKEENLAEAPGNYLDETEAFATPCELEEDFTLPVAFSRLLALEK